MAFGLFLPPAYFKGNQPLPLILSLHNKGLESNDGRGLEFEGLGAICARDAWDDRNAAATTRPANAMNLRTDAKFIAVMPQCYPGMSFALSPMPEIIAETIKEVSKAYRVDSRRIYLTGFSYGGTSTWQLAEAMPNQFAAIVPIAGRATAAPAITAATLKDVGVYLACGTADGMLPQVRAMRDALAAAGHARMVYREIMDGTHWCYAVVYTDPEFWQWLLRRPESPRNRQVETIVRCFVLCIAIMVAAVACPRSRPRHGLDSVRLLARA